MMNTFFLFMPQQQDGKGAGGWEMLVFFLLIIVVFYFFMIRPQQRKQKKIQQLRESIKRGDHIITIGGIHGKITDVQESTFTIEVEDGTKMKIEKAAVAIDGNEANKK